MAYANEYGSGINLTAMVTPVLQAAVFAAQESSLYMGGNLVPVIQVPQNSASAQVPLMGSVTATTISAAAGETDPGADFASTLPSNTAITIALDLIAARTTVRDLGNIDFNDIGRILGNSVANAWDKAVTTTFGALTSQTSLGAAGTLTVPEIFTAIGTIRGNGETGDLFGIVGTNTYAALMASIGGAAFAGGEFQNSAMRNGYFGHVGGVPLYVSSYLNDTDMGTVGKAPAAAIMSRDAVKSVQQGGGLNVEFARRAEAVGFDIVASLAAGVSMVDVTRGVFIEQ
jgi:hypothetical protein